MKILDVIFLIVFAPVMYFFYGYAAQVVSTELSIMLTVWLVLIVPTIWFACENCRDSTPQR